MASGTRIVPTQLVWDHSASAGVDLDYQVRGLTTTKPTTIAFYWASGTDYAASVTSTGTVVTNPTSWENWPIPTQFLPERGPQALPYGPVHVPGSNLTGVAARKQYFS